MPPEDTKELCCVSAFDHLSAHYTASRAVDGARGPRSAAGNLFSLHNWSHFVLRPRELMPRALIRFFTLAGEALRALGSRAEKDPDDERLKPYPVCCVVA